MAKQFDYLGKRAIAPDCHSVVCKGTRMVDIGMDIRSMPEDIDEGRCPRCENILPLDGLCDCSGSEDW